MNNPVGALVTRIVDGCIWISTQYPRVVIAAFTVVLCICLQILPTLQIETNAFTRLDEDNRIRTDTAHIEREFGGSLNLDVFITSDTPGRMLDVEVLNQLAEFEQRAEELPEVSPSTTFVDLMRRTHATIGGKGPLPTSREAIAQELLLFEMGGGSSLDPILDFDRSSTHMSLRIDEHRMRATHFLAQDLSQLGREIMSDDLKIEVSGVGPLTGAWLDEIVTGQRNGMLLSIVAICVLMMIGLRSVSVGILSMIPNLLPLVVVATTTGLVYGDIDSDTLVVLMMAIGIGVDDTIHFLMRYRIESDRHEDNTEAIRQTFNFAGRAIVMTTVILAAGYFPLFFSEYYSMSIMGSMLPLALVVAMIADLLLVPALAQVGWLKYRRQRDSA
jgi:predicted RND superfamily exporter protein